MKRNMRHTKQKLEEKEAWDMLDNAFYGVLSTVSEQGVPYGVPLHHVLSDNKLYFHSSLEGHKLENIASNPKVSFTVIGETKKMPKFCATHFKSVIAFGNIKKLQNVEEIIKVVYLLCEKNTPTQMETLGKVISANIPRLCALEMTIEHISGKASAA